MMVRILSVLNRRNHHGTEFDQPCLLSSRVTTGIRIAFPDGYWVTHEAA